MSQAGTYSLMVHGGAGALDNVKDNKTAVRYLDSIRRILEHGRDVIELGDSALQAVEACAPLVCRSCYPCRYRIPDRKSTRSWWSYCHRSAG